MPFAVHGADLDLLMRAARPPNPQILNPGEWGAFLVNAEFQWAEY